MKLLVQSFQKCHCINLSDEELQDATVLDIKNILKLEGIYIILLTAL